MSDFKWRHFEGVVILWGFCQGKLHLAVANC